MIEPNIIKLPTRLKIRFQDISKDNVLAKVAQETQTMAPSYKQNKAKIGEIHGTVDLGFKRLVQEGYMSPEPQRRERGRHGPKDLGSVAVNGGDRMVMVLVRDGDRMVMLLVGDGDWMVMVLVGHADRMVMVLVGDGDRMVTVLVEGGDW